MKDMARMMSCDGQFRQEEAVNACTRFAKRAKYQELLINVFASLQTLLWQPGITVS
jgi:hypothetical protein